MPWHQLQFSCCVCATANQSAPEKKWVYTTTENRFINMVNIVQCSVSNWNGTEYAHEITNFGNIKYWCLFIIFMNMIIETFISHVVCTHVQHGNRFSRSKYDCTFLPVVWTTRFTVQRHASIHFNYSNFVDDRIFSGVIVWKLSQFVYHVCIKILGLLFNRLNRISLLHIKRAQEQKWRGTSVTCREIMNKFSFLLPPIWMKHNWWSTEKSCIFRWKK